MTTKNNRRRRISYNDFFFRFLDKFEDVDCLVVTDTGVRYEALRNSEFVALVANTLRVKPDDVPRPFINEVKKRLDNYSFFFMTEANTYTTKLSVGGRRERFIVTSKSCIGGLYEDLEDGKYMRDFVPANVPLEGFFYDDILGNPLISNIITLVKRYCSAEEIDGAPGIYTVSTKGFDTFISDFFYCNPVDIKQQLAEVGFLLHDKDTYDFSVKIDNTERRCCLLRKLDCPCSVFGSTDHKDFFLVSFAEEAGDCPKHIHFSA